MAGADAVAAGIRRGVSALRYDCAGTPCAAAAGEAHRASAPASRRGGRKACDRGRRCAWSRKDSRDQNLASTFKTRGLGWQARWGCCPVRVADPRHPITPGCSRDRSGTGSADRTRTRDTNDRARRNDRVALAANPAIRLPRLGRDRCLDPLTAKRERTSRPRHPSESWDLTLGPASPASRNTSASARVTAKTSSIELYP